MSATAATVDRSTQAAGRIDILDGWRGLAILFVIESHFLFFFEERWRWDFGRIGIDIFLALSGLLMSRILFEQRMGLGTFYRRRVSRILPVFVVFVIVVFGLAAARGLPTSLGEFFATLFFLRTYVPPGVSIWASALPIGHLWSLHVEEHSYLLLGIVAAIGWWRGREAGVLLGLGCAMVLCHALYLKFEDAPIPSAFQQHTEAAGGPLMLSAGYYLVRRRFVPWVRGWMPVLALVLGVVTYFPVFPGRPHVVLEPFLMAFAVNHIDAVRGPLRRLLESRPLRLLGLWSYSIYLWQQPFYLYKDSVGLPGWLATPLALVATMVVAIASYYLLERPVRDWLNRRWGRSTSLRLEHTGAGRPGNPASLGGPGRPPKQSGAVC